MAFRIVDTTLTAAELEAGGPELTVHAEDLLADQPVVVVTVDRVRYWGTVASPSSESGALVVLGA